MDLCNWHVMVGWVTMVSWWCPFTRGVILEYLVHILQIVAYRDDLFMLALPWSLGAFNARARSGLDRKALFIRQFCSLQACSLRPRRRHQHLWIPLPQQAEVCQLQEEAHESWLQGSRVCHTSPPCRSPVSHILSMSSTVQPCISRCSGTPILVRDLSTIAPLPRSFGAPFVVWLLTQLKMRKCTWPWAILITFKGGNQRNDHGGFLAPQYMFKTIRGSSQDSPWCSGTGQVRMLRRSGSVWSERFMHFLVCFIVDEFLEASVSGDWDDRWHNR